MGTPRLNLVKAERRQSPILPGWRRAVDVQEAISKAKEYGEQVYSEENVSNLGLEETEYQEDAGQHYAGVFAPLEYSTH
jgi:hypothetical protein